MFQSKNTIKKRIDTYYTNEIKAHIIRIKLTAFYYLLYNLLSIFTQFIIITYLFPDILYLLGIKERDEEEYEGANYYINSILSYTTKFISIGISYIPIISQAKDLLNSLINITIGLIGLYIGYRIFALTILNSIFNAIENLKVSIMGHDEDNARLKKIQRYCFRMNLLYKTLDIHTILNDQFKSISDIERENILLNVIINSNNIPEEYRMLRNEIEVVSDDILKQSISNKYVLKNENFIEKQIQTQMCIETMFKEMKGKIKYT